MVATKRDRKASLFSLLKEVPLWIESEKERKKKKEKERRKRKRRFEERKKKKKRRKDINRVR